MSVLQMKLSKRVEGTPKVIRSNGKTVVVEHKGTIQKSEECILQGKIGRRKEESKNMKVIFKKEKYWMNKEKKLDEEEKNIEKQHRGK